MWKEAKINYKSNFRLKKFEFSTKKIRILQVVFYTRLGIIKKHYMYSYQLNFSECPQENRIKITQCNFLLP